MGTPATAVPVFRRLCDLPGVEVVAAVTPPDRPRGRGSQPQAPPVKQEALRIEVPVLQPQSLRSRDAQEQLARLQPQVIVVAAYGLLLPAEVLELPAHGCLNLHPSLLPRHRGPSPVATAILEGDRTTGVSLMLLDLGMDTGPVIARREVGLEDNETTGDLTDRLFELGGELLAECIGGWVRGEMNAEPQDEALATATRKLERADGEADWTLPADVLARRCRAFDPWPGLHTRWQGRTLKILSASPLGEEQDNTPAPGRVASAGTRSGLCVATGSGLLALGRVQLEGRRPVAGDEFVRGYPDVLGATLGQ